MTTQEVRVEDLQEFHTVDLQQMTVPPCGEGHAQLSGAMDPSYTLRNRVHHPLTEEEKLKREAFLREKMEEL